MASHGLFRAGGGPSKTDKERQKELSRISKYEVLVSRVNRAAREKQYDQAALDISSDLLSWNPEYYSIWNYRRRIIRHQLIQTCLEHGSDDAKDVNKGKQDLLAQELASLIYLLRQFPKCYWIWNYRLWLLEQSKDFLPLSATQAFWQQELGIVSKMLSLDARNFHGWNYRRIAVAALESSGESLVETEFEYTTRMINTSLSNFSAWHYRSKLIPRLLNQRQASRDDRIRFLNEELNLIQRALWAGDNDSSLWFYHQNLMSNFNARYAALWIVPDLSESERVEYVKAELAKVLDMLDGAEDCKWIYQALIELCILYREIAHEFPEEGKHLVDWLGTLGRIDPLRAKRWHDTKI